MLETYGTGDPKSSFCGQKGSSSCRAKLMPAPSARQLEQRAEEARIMAGQMHDPETKRAMVNLALSYELLAKHAAQREESGAAHGAVEQSRNRVAFIVVIGSSAPCGHRCEEKD